jgi:hypothetical protein
MKTLFFLLILVFSLPVAAQSCFPLLEAESKRIHEKNSYTTHVGGQLYINNGQLGYWPGIEVAGQIRNWARDFDRAIKWGPLGYDSYYDQRGEILKVFRNSIRRSCPQIANDQAKLRNMLKELMEDGSFCPQGELLSRPFLSRWKFYKRAMREAIDSGRFDQDCNPQHIQDDSSRIIKDVTPDRGSESSRDAKVQGL